MWMMKRVFNWQRSYWHWADAFVELLGYIHHSVVTSNEIFDKLIRKCYKNTVFHGCIKFWQIQWFKWTNCPYFTYILLNICHLPLLKCIFCNKSTKRQKSMDRWTWTLSKYRLFTRNNIKTNVMWPQLHSFNSIEFNTIEFKLYFNHNLISICTKYRFETKHPYVW